VIDKGSLAAKPTQRFVSSGLAFLAVGLAAGCTHYGVFTGVLLGLPMLLPELANAAGFAVAFWVSFTGHRLLSFKDHNTALKSSFLRFATVAGLGFVTNELAFILVHRGLGWVPGISVIVGMGVASLLTFVLSRYWAFKR
jgi:putative flippase GtrA